MKTLIQHISESKALHQNVNISEKLIINKDYGKNYDFSKNLKFEKGQKVLTIEFSKQYTDWWRIDVRTITDKFNSTYNIRLEFDNMGIFDCIITENPGVLYAYDNSGDVRLIFHEEYFPIIIDEIIEDQYQLKYVIPEYIFDLFEIKVPQNFNKYDIKRKRRSYDDEDLDDLKNEMKK